MSPNVRILQELSYFEKGILKKYFNPSQPFGPRSSEVIADDDFVQSLIFNTRNSVWQSYKRDPKIIVGRRGSGKTTIVSRTELRDRFKYLIFAQMSVLAEKVDNSMLANEPLKMGLAERCSRYWDFVLNIQLMIEVVRSNPSMPFPRISSFLESIDSSPDNSKSYLKKAYEAVNSAELNNSVGSLLASIRSFLEATAHGYQEALEDLDFFLKERTQRSIVVLDNLEEYDLDDYRTEQVLKGLLKCVGNFGNDHRQIRLCIPAEHFFELKAISSNVTKDFGSAIVLHWSPIELMRIAAWRYLIFLACHNHMQRLSKFTNVDLSKRDDVHFVLSEFMRDTTINRGRKIEGTLAYILRHTQLLPRQFIMALNSIYCSPEDKGFNYEASVAEGIKNVEGDICSDIFNAFQRKYPFCADLCDRVIENLPRFFGDNVLHEVFSQYGKGALKSRGDIDYHRFRQILSEIGAIGKVTDRLQCTRMQILSTASLVDYPFPRKMRFASIQHFPEPLKLLGTASRRGSFILIWNLSSLRDTLTGGCRCSCACNG